jgi:hypothetical protein
MIDKREFLDAIQQGNKETFDVFLAQVPLDNHASGQGILIALDLGKVDEFCQLVDLYTSNLADLSNDQGYTFFNRVPDSFRQVIRNNNDEETLSKLKKLQTKLIELISSKQLLQQSDIFEVTLRQYLLCSYREPIELRELVKKQIGEAMPSNPIAQVAWELGIKVEDIPAGQNPIVLYKIKRFIEDNQADNWRKFLKELYVELNENEYEVFLSELQETIQDSSSLQELKTALQSLATAKLGEFTQPMNSFFGGEFLDLLNANDDEFLEACKRTILLTITNFNLEFFESKKTIDKYIEDFKTDPKTAYIFELYSLFNVAKQLDVRVVELTSRLYLAQLGKEKAQLKPMKYYLEEARKYVELEKKFSKSLTFESVDFYLKEAKQYFDLETDLNTELKLFQLGRKGRAIQKAYQALMFDALSQNTPFEEFKSNLCKTYQQKMPPPQSTQADTEKTKPNNMQPISLFQRLINILKNVFSGEQKPKLDVFFDNLNKNRNCLFKQKYTTSMKAFSTIFREPEAGANPENGEPDLLKPQ